MHWWWFRWKGQEGSKNPMGLGTVNEKKGEAWQLRADASFENMTATECRCNANDAIMNATNKRNTWQQRKTWKPSGASVSGRYNTPPLQEDLVPRSRMAPEKSGRGREEVKLSCFFDKRVKPKNLERLNERKERIQGRWTRLKTLRYQRGTRNIARTFVGWKTWNKSFKNQKNMTTLVEKRNKEHHVNLGVCKAMNDENNGREVHASTPVETRCTRNDKDQLR